jgi:hypothetical protein
MTELVVKRIEVDLKYVPKGWATQVMFDELERGVVHAVADGKAEVHVPDICSNIVHWFALKDVPLDTKLEGHKAFLSVDIYEQMTMVHHLVSLEQGGV